MPTPSSNQPPSPLIPSPYAFSTCPDDLQHSPRPRHEPHDVVQTESGEMEVQHSPLTGATSSPEFDPQPMRDSRTGEGSAALTAQTSLEPSSRATTVSPRPQSNSTGITSPSPYGATSDQFTTQEICPGGYLSQEAANKSQRLENGKTAPLAGEADDLDLTIYEEDCSSPSMGLGCSTIRAIPTSPSSYLRPGSRFRGTQQSERQVYDVQVEIKHVDMRESFLCGYLRIQGLTEDHPTLTTYFEGEILGTKYHFLTQHEDWGASNKVDLSHWAKFSAFRPFQKHARKGPVIIQDAAQRENIFMRWKEHFLVPDHRVRTITGASFEGFYYICFNQIKGEVSGIYFHSKSEKFQQLELKHVSDRGCFGSMEFR